jgi:hypothetical protein
MMMICASASCRSTINTSTPRCVCLCLIEQDDKRVASLLTHSHTRYVWPIFGWHMHMTLGPRDQLMTALDCTSDGMFRFRMVVVTVYRSKGRYPLTATRVPACQSPRSGPPRPRSTVRPCHRPRLPFEHTTSHSPC